MGQTKSKKNYPFKIDSLFKEIKKSIESDQSAKASASLEYALQLIQESKDDIRKQTAYYLYGNLYYHNKDYKSAEGYYSSSLSLAIKYKDYENQIVALEKIVECKIKLKEFEEAEQKCMQLIETYKQASNPYGQANTYSKLGSIYFELKEMEKAQKALENASIIFKQIKKNDLKKIEEEPVTEISRESEREEKESNANQLQQDKNAGKNIQSSSIKNKKTKSNKAAQALKQIAVVYKQMGNFIEAKNNFNYSIELYKKEENYHEMAACLVSLGDIELNTKNYKGAIIKYKEVLELSKEQNLKISKMESYKGISLCLSLMQDYKNAFNYYQKYVAERDLIYAEEKEDELQKLRAQMEIEKKQIQIRLLKKEKEIDKLELEKSAIWLYTLSALSVLLLFLALLIYNRYLLKKRLNAILYKQNKDLEHIIYELKESETELSTLNSTKDKFFSIISHDIKAPLNSLKGYLNIAKEFPENISSKEIKDFAHIMDVSLSNLSGLLNNLLEWAMVQSGAIQVSIVHVNLVQLIKKQAELFLPQFLDKHISFVLQANEEIEVMGDKNMLEFIFRNIIHNAIKFTNTGGEVKVEILEENKSVVIKIIDNGIGMDKSMLDNLFNPDTRNTLPGTKKEKGSGLGLMLCKDFVQMNRGDITAESKPNEGSTFTIKLPMGY
ncbi:MAG: tetratricopeptide repeat-containing sensor histidine kinase [Bacteroidota bacterium]|nr:tetratricopeptide repeat-containing sensor histidine kinase [Bacteroidota bacterium]